MLCYVLKLRALEKKIKKGNGIWSVGQGHDFNCGGQGIQHWGDIQEKTRKWEVSHIGMAGKGMFRQKDSSYIESIPHESEE